MKRNIIIVGAGASGMMAAIMAAREGAEVLLLEQKDAVGKKLLATGNGHCNFTNSVLNKECYHENSWVMEKLAVFGLSKTLDFFEELGIYPVEKDGYYYPASGQASSVAELFLQELKRLQVKICTEAQVKKIIPKDRGFDVEYIKTEHLPLSSDAARSGMHGAAGNHKKGNKKKPEKEEIRTKRCTVHGDKVILSCGGKAAPKLGSDGSGYYLAGLLGHGLVEPLPALCGIQCKEEWFGKLAGIRIPATVRVHLDNEITEIYTEAAGELQLTDYGISGIPVFQISGPVAKALHKGIPLKISLHFHPEIEEEVYKKYLSDHSKAQYKGLFPGALCEVLDQVSGSLETKTLYVTPVKVNDFDRAQVTTGGIPLEEIHKMTLESLICPGVYITGELLDVDGICGGYNLQWAWTSGAIAGRCAAGRQ